MDLESAEAESWTFVTASVGRRGSSMYGAMVDRSRSGCEGKGEHERTWATCLPSISHRSFASSP